MKYDFGGWATRNDLECADGRIIKKDAFKSQNGEKVPLVWNHNHSAASNVLGHAYLENRDDGVYAYCEFNETESGKTAKELVQHGDVRSLSIMANKLVQTGHDVIHGIIREVSLVLAGANPGAFIDDVMAHGDGESGIIIGYDENIMLYHSDDEDEKDKKKTAEKDESKEASEKQTDKTAKEIFDTLSEEQKNVVYDVVRQALETPTEPDKTEEKDENDNNKSKGGTNSMKHNVFDGDQQQEKDSLTHSDQQEILAMAKMSNIGTFQNALTAYTNEHTLQHDATSGGFDTNTVGKLFPDYQEVRPGAPELITNDQGWISRVLSKVHKSPISRIRTSQVDIRNIDGLKAKGYQKGKEKKNAGNFSLVRRTTDPQTIYVKNALHRDDIVDITDFDYVAYLYNIDRMMLDEELAIAIMLGDGREDGDADKITPDKVRPIWSDDDLYTIHADLDLAAAKKELQGGNTSLNFGSNYIYAEALIEAVLHARENYKGSGTPDYYCTPASLNTMLLARDLNGRRMYNSVAELASALNVAGIYTAEQFAGKKRKTSDGKTKKLLGIVCNLEDYALGATKGGEISHFTQFDIDFNQEKSLLETRVSGALHRVYSAIAIEEDVTASSNSVSDTSDHAAG